MKAKAGAGLAGMVLSIFAAAACGNHTTSEDPALVATWAATSSQGGAMSTETIDLNGDGTASLGVSISGSSQGIQCMGSLSFTGFTWTSTATTISLTADNPKCSGSIACDGVTLFDCTTLPPSPQKTGTCSYTLSSDDDTLSLTCSADGGTSTTVLERQH
jgi:hypothetical protein